MRDPLFQDPVALYVQGNSEIAGCLASLFCPRARKQLLQVDLSGLEVILCPASITTTALDRVATATSSTPVTALFPLAGQPQANGCPSTTCMSPKPPLPHPSPPTNIQSRFNSNKPLMFSSCSNTYSQVDDSGPEVGAIYDAIQSAATSTSIDPRFILAVIMQESGGCVRAPTSNYGVRNPGLMQDHNGAGTCNDNGQVQNPCPTATVRQMISEGTAGTADGDGLAQGIGKAGAGDVSAFYKAARIYNSGTVDPSGDLGKGIATHCYASDIANRLTGWVMAPHGCNL